ncbi:NUDIX domain-containing protein [Comamonas sp. NLF-1-9]|uniref:NUDIX hydrolase n=1 Tax=Comamonas sp. NLF-1-9 TaxID=2853163 RepID=UPI001C4439AC|nr:NUDIX domain-containing protein [Comamonas sp. NLF-1-9]QXL84960.1 NUDIX domain-containing protein [Comamonas sp. NLF-1-9]
MNQPAAPWLSALRAAARRGPQPGRIALHLGDAQVGSVAAEILNEIGLKRLLGERYQLLFEERNGVRTCTLPAAQASQALNALAALLREIGRCGPWRDEQLAVRDAAGRQLATVERGAVRVLGIATDAVHLVGLSEDAGALWVQQRSRTKPSHPGQWDTLMGGMVSARDSLRDALARETQEEAGLQLSALTHLQAGAPVLLDQPSDEGGARLGHLHERIHWWSARLPQAVAPVNQDGEVERFECWSHAEVQARLAAGAFTPEAALVLGAFYEGV